MKNFFYPYLWLVIALLFQVSISPLTVWCPDLLLLAAISFAVFSDTGKGLMFSFLAGFLRGLMSVHTLPVDIVIFPLLAFVSVVISRIFYRHNPVTHIFITALAIFSLIAAHLTYLNIISGNQMNLGPIFEDSWRTITSTIFLAPFIFAMVGRQLEGRK